MFVESLEIKVTLQLERFQEIIKEQYHSGQYCSAFNSSVDNYRLITDPLLPVNDGTRITLSCRTNYVNLENTSSSAECRNGTVVATSTLPRCVGGEVQKESCAIARVLFKHNKR